MVPPSLYEHVSQELLRRGNYEITANPRDISKLAGMTQLLTLLGNPQNTYSIIHIAGTNGKGLTGAMLARVLSGEGVAVGWYNSPHLIDIRERIQIQDHCIAKDLFAQITKRVLDTVEQVSEYLSYFDLLTAIALLAFAQTQREWVILETGLGGTADSTNAIAQKALCILTPISKDHIHVLGNDLQEIATEKLGITRAHIPVILSSQPPEISRWIQDHLQKKSVPYHQSENIQIQAHSSFLEIIWQDQERLQFSARQRFSSAYLESLKMVLLAREQISPQLSLPLLSRKKWVESALQTYLPGRLDLKRAVKGKDQSNFEVVLMDGGHNPQAIQQLREYLCEFSLQKTTLVFGVAKDKLIPELHPQVVLLLSEVDQVILTQTQSKRATTPQELYDWIFSTHSLPIPVAEAKITMALTLEEALSFTNISTQNLIIAGSFYLVGEAFSYFDFKTCVA